MELPAAMMRNVMSQSEAGPTSFHRVQCETGTVAFPKTNDVTGGYPVTGVDDVMEMAAAPHQLE